MQGPLLVRESGSRRPARPALEAAQRRAVSHIATSLEAMCAGYGYTRWPEDKIRAELGQSILKPLPLAEGERCAELYLVFAGRDAPGPGRPVFGTDHPRDGVRTRRARRRRATGRISLRSNSKEMSP